MDLKKLNGKEMAQYQKTIKNFMSENELVCFGSACIAIENFPEIDGVLLNGVEINNKNFNKNLINELKKFATALERKLIERFEIFFDRCVGYENIKSYMRDMICNIKIYSSALLKKDDEKFSQFCEISKLNSELNNLELFIEDLENYGDILKNLIDEAYKASC